MPRLLSRLLLVLLVLLSSGVMPVPMRASKSRSCCAVKSSCDMMRAEPSGQPCCRLPARANDPKRADGPAQPSDACVLAAMACRPAAASAPSAPIVFQFIVPATPVCSAADAKPLLRRATEAASIEATRDLLPRPPRRIAAPVSRA